MSNTGQLLGFAIATLALLAFAELQPEFAAGTMGIVVLGALLTDPSGVLSLSNLINPQNAQAGENKK